MTPMRFKQVDVFSAIPFRGNPVAVVFDADRLSEVQMQAVARWTNLSETTFVLAARATGADYRLRIFTPGGELPFAGHPTLGSAHAVLEAGFASLRNGMLVQECGVGLVRIHVAALGGRLALELPAAKIRPLGAALIEQVAAAVGLPIIGEAAIVDLGPRWLTARTESVDALRAAKPDFAVIAALSRELRITGINLFARSAMATEVRSFAPAFGVDEDPVCGSGNGAVAALLRSEGVTEPYTARQGRSIGRDGFAFLDFVSDGPIRLAGDAITCVDGHLIAPDSE